MFSLLKTLFYYPLLNLLVFLYGIFGSFGLAIIVLTIIVRVALFHFSKSSIISQRKMADLQPELKKLQDKHKDNKEQQTKAIFELYKTNNINPFSGFLPMLIQIPVVFSLYQVFLKVINSVASSDLYSFISLPHSINFHFLWYFDLSHPSKFLAVFAGLTQFLQSKYAMKAQKPTASGEFASAMNYQMVYLFPVIALFIGWTMPAGLTLYWTVGAILSIIQQLIIEKYYINKKS